MKKRTIPLFCLLIILHGAPLSLFAENIFWEEPVILAGPNLRFPATASGNGVTALVWQEFEYTAEKSGAIYLTIWTSRDMMTWLKRPRFLGPIPFAEKETQVFSLAMNGRGEILLAVTVNDTDIALYHSPDEGRNFSLSTVKAPIAVVSPKLFTVTEEDTLLFVTYAIEETLTIYYCRLKKGLFAGQSQASPFEPFVDDTALGINFLPYYTSFRNREYVAFQSRLKGETTGFQLYLKTSDDRGKTWAEAIPLSDFSETQNNQKRDSRDFFNQRPFIKEFGNRLIVVWERQYRTETSQIYYMELKETGERIRFEKVTALPNLICYYPRAVVFRNVLYLVWFDNRRGEDHVILGEKKGIDWTNTDLSQNLPGSSQFAESVENGGSLYIFWQNKTAGKSNLVLLQPDQTVAAPVLTPENFINGKKANQAKVTIRWNTPRDSSGIAAYRYSWGKDSTFNAGALKNVRTGNSITLDSPDDGTYYFFLVAQDYAGNVASPVSVKYIKDGTPPGEVVFAAPATDIGGFLDSNSFSLSWMPPADDAVSGFSYGLAKVSSDLKTDMTTLTGGSATVPPASVMTVTGAKSFVNLDNGVYSFTVRAIDTVGNAGRPATLFFKLNKYRPFTTISNVFPSEDEMGKTHIKITGRGFLSDGRVVSVLLDRDGIEPYDYVYTETGGYTIKGDGLIDGIVLEDIREDTYRIGLIHEKRGVYFTQPLLKLKPFGTLVIGPFDKVEEFKWIIGSQPAFSFNMQEFLMWLLMLFLGLFAVMAAQKLLSIAREAYVWKMEVALLLKGDMHAEVKERTMSKLKIKGVGLRLKFASLITTLVIMIVLMVSVTLSYYMIQTQRRNLADGLLKQAKVLLNSLTLAAEKYLPVNETIELGVLPNQSKAMEDAESATITAFRAVNTVVPSKDEYVWATNDKNIQTRVAGQEYRAGESVYSDDVTKLLPELASRINIKAIESVSDLVEQSRLKTEEADKLQRKEDPQSVRRYNELAASVTEINASITEILRGIGSEIGSYPVFDPDNMEKGYIFFKPIVYRRSGEDIYFRGLVRLALSTQRIQETILNSQTELVYRIGFITLIAIVLGILGAILLASITISPIKKLAKGVAVIRDTEDKSLLKDHTITIKQKDEIRMLADTINQMTVGLVKAAIANKDLTVGKEVQKMFIPLEKDSNGRKLTTGGETSDLCEIFGYYEGAKGVSGDYFDFAKLDDSHYALIKCDVSGKGVPAALIMVEVATIFIDYFRGWTLANPGLKIDKLVYKINDLLEGRGFKGRFAALIIGIVNVKTGTAILCNAGDNIVNVYVEKEKRMTQVKLPEAPAAGVFPSMLVEMQAGFKQVNLKLDKGDMLLLYSDGIDESERYFRDAASKPVKCNEPSLKENESHNGTHKKDDESEEMGQERVYAIMDAILKKSKYTLVKEHNPLPAQTFTFDFSGCKSSIRDIILGIISVEKIFRLYRDPLCGPDDKILVDKKVDEFLQLCFVEYGRYFTDKTQAEYPEYIGFSHLKEDDQYDDLTVLGIMKR